MIFDGCVFDPAVFDAAPCAVAEGGHILERRPRRRIVQRRIDYEEEAAVIALLLDG